MRNNEPRRGRGILRHGLWYNREIKILLLLILSIMLICAIIQYADFSVRFNEKRVGRWSRGIVEVDDLEQALQAADGIRFRYSLGFRPDPPDIGEVDHNDYGEAQQTPIDIDEYEQLQDAVGGDWHTISVSSIYVYSGEDGLYINIYQVPNRENEYSAEPIWRVDYRYDAWRFLREAPTLPDLLSETINAPLLISMIILLPVMSIILIERDYSPSESVLTLLRLPRTRERYLLSKLIWPTALTFLFWGLQFLVAVIQRARYFSIVQAYARPVGQPIWKFDYYRILYPFIEPIWFPATISALCVIPAVIVTIIFIVKGGMKSRVYAVLPVVGFVAAILTINRVSQLWWIMPVLLAAVYLNGKMLINKGQIVR